MAHTTAEIEHLIRAAYQTVTTTPGAWVKLTDLREAIGDVNRHHVDQAIDQMFPEAQVMPESNAKTLTQTDRDLAIWSGGEWNHLICIR